MKKTRKLSLEYRKLFRNKKYRKSLAAGILFIILAGILMNLSINYADAREGNSLGDLILDNIPTINFFWFRAFGTFLIALSVPLIGFLKPKYFPALLKTMGLMYSIRAFFVAITYIKTYPAKVPVFSAFPIWKDLFPYQGNDLFFSGHVAYPFLAALVFWDNKPVRTYLLIAAAFSGIVSLFAKTHYSIDTFAAPFIAYSIFKIGEKLFKEDFSYIK